MQDIGQTCHKYCVLLLYLEICTSNIMHLKIECIIVNFIKNMYIATYEFKF